MQKLITKYGLAAHLAITAVAPLFLSPVAVTCLAVLALIWVIMEPSRVGDEMLHNARSRVVRNAIKDPFTWVMAALLIAAIVRVMNGGVALRYDAETTLWQVSAPSVAFLPGTVDGADAYFLPAMVAAFVLTIACRQALGRSARLVTILLASTLSGLGALVWAMMYHDGNESVRTMAICGLEDPLFVGSVFGLLLMGAVVALEAAFERAWYLAMALPILGIVGNTVGLMLFAPPAVVLLYAGALLVFYVYVFVYIRLKLGKTRDFKHLVVVGVAIVLALGVVYGMMSHTDFAAHYDAFLTGTFVPGGYQAIRSQLGDLSLRIWQEHPWLGCGLGSYSLELGFYASPEDWEIISPVQKAPLNGYWLLMVERGVVGCFLLLVPILLAVIDYFRRLVSRIMVELPHPLCFLAPILALVVALEVLVDVSYTASTVVPIVVMMVHISINAFPKKKESHGR